MKSRDMLERLSVVVVNLLLCDKDSVIREFKVGTSTMSFLMKNLFANLSLIPVTTILLITSTTKVTKNRQSRFPCLNLSGSYKPLSLLAIYCNGK